MSKLEKVENQTIRNFATRKRTFYLAAEIRVWKWRSATTAAACVNFRLRSKVPSTNISTKFTTSNTWLLIWSKRKFRPKVCLTGRTRPKPTPPCPLRDALCSWRLADQSACVTWGGNLRRPNWWAFSFFNIAQMHDLYTRGGYNTGRWVPKRPDSDSLLLLRLPGIWELWSQINPIPEPLLVLDQFNLVICGWRIP